MKYRYPSPILLLLCWTLLMTALAACTSSATGGERMTSDQLLPIQLPEPGAQRERPLVAVLADNAGTETTDFMVPYGVLRASGVADVVAVSTGPGTVQLHPALNVRADQTIDQFDRAHATGADIVIVPAMHNPDNPEVLAWVRQQYNAGATIVGICDGVWILAKAGLLEQKVATGHWYSLDRLARQYPDTTWVRDHRYVADGQVVTTTGVSASVPVSLALVEAIAGTAEAVALAERLDVNDFGTAHETARFQLSTADKARAAANWLSFWRRERIDLPVADDVNEITLALAADAWSRTFRSTARANHADATTIRSRHGLVIETDNSRATRRHTPEPTSHSPEQTLNETLAAIAERYDVRTAELVAVQLEYPWDISQQE